MIASINYLYRGFTFLGYWITAKGVTGVAPSIWKVFRERVARLYEQNALQEKILRRIGQYVRRWQQWVLSGLGEWKSRVVWPFPLFCVTTRQQAAQYISNQ